MGEGVGVGLTVLLVVLVALVATLPSIRASRATAHRVVVQQVLGISGRPDATEDQHSDSHRVLVLLPYTLLCDQQILLPGTRCAGR